MMLTNDAGKVIRDIYGVVKFYVMTRLETQIWCMTSYFAHGKIW
jgi:hypothetical protein